MDDICQVNAFEFAKVASYVDTELRPKGKRRSPGGTAKMSSSSFSEGSEETTLAVPEKEGLQLFQSQRPAAKLDKSVSMPKLHAGRMGVVKAQYNLLQVEEQAQDVTLKRMSRTMKDSLARQKQAQARSESHFKIVQDHVLESRQLENHMENVRRELEEAQRDARGGQEATVLDDSNEDEPVPIVLDPGRPPPPEKRPPKAMKIRGSILATTKEPGDNIEQKMKARRTVQLEDAFEVGDKAKSRPSFARAKSMLMPSKEIRALSESLQDKIDVSESSATDEDSEAEEADAVELSLAEKQAKARAIIRKAMISKLSAKDAFKKMDLNGSGNLSLQEFLDGMDRLHVVWKPVTRKYIGKTHERDVFKLFDVNKDGHLDFKELFPPSTSQGKRAARPSTPDAWKNWVRSNHEDEFADNRPAKWAPDNPADVIASLYDSKKTQQEVIERRRWIQASFRRLKAKGKTDAKCRETICVHLPRGTGPRDRDGCHTFSEKEVKDCKTGYSSHVLEPVKNIQKVIYQMRDQRWVLKESRQQLYAVALKPYEEAKQAASAPIFAGLGGGFGKKGDEGAGPDAAAVESVRRSFSMGGLGGGLGGMLNKTQAKGAPADFSRQTS
jgi:hypothetical protein